MKFIFLVLIISLALQADEIKRIESIVNDITKLRIKHQKCEDNLETQNVKIKEYENSIKNLKTKIKYLKKQVKSKETNKKTSLKSNKIILKPKEETIETIVYQKCEETNPFPKLVMKEGKQPEKPLTTTVESIEYFKARAFRLNTDADIYDAINGKTIDNWENKTSFTSNQRTATWIKITGYFVDKVWRKSDLEMWVKATHATKR